MKKSGYIHGRLNKLLCCDYDYYDIFMLTLVEMVVMTLLCAAVKRLIKQSKIAAKRLIAS